MKFIHRIIISALIIFTILPSQVSAKKKDTNNTPKYIFFFIGDGMAASQVRLAEAALSVDEFRTNFALRTGLTMPAAELALKSLNILGLATSNAQDRYITDSAAAGTALATGSKTNVGMISKNPEGETLMTIAEKAKKKGMKVGIVSSVTIDHATPASFYSHANNRSEYYNISNQLLTSGFDYFAGGSIRYDHWMKEFGCDLPTAHKKFNNQAKGNGFIYATTRAEFDALKNGKPAIATLDRLANDSNSGGGAMPYTIDLTNIENKDDKISLADFTAKGIELLDNKDGFFMMVEGGKIDWACHANDAATVAYEVVAFDKAVAEAIEFAKKHPNETLIVVTGDHDCGGLSIGYAGTAYSSAFELLAGAKTSSDTFSYQVDKRINEGQSFEQLLQYACENYGFTDNDHTDKGGNLSAELSNFEVEKLKKAYLDCKNHDELSATAKRVEYGNYNPFSITCSHLLNNKSGITFSSYSHTAVPVLIFADGVGAEIFSGYYDNTDIPKKIIEAAGL